MKEKRFRLGRLGDNVTVREESDAQLAEAPEKGPEVSEQVGSNRSVAPAAPAHEPWQSLKDRRRPKR